MNLLQTTHLIRKCNTCDSLTALAYTIDGQNGKPEEIYICTSCLKKLIHESISSAIQESKGWEGFSKRTDDPVHVSLQFADLHVKRLRSIKTEEVLPASFILQVSSYVFNDDIVFFFRARNESEFLDAFDAVIDKALKNSVYPNRDFYF